MKRFRFVVVMLLAAWILLSSTACSPSASGSAAASGSPVSHRTADGGTAPDVRHDTPPEPAGQDPAQNTPSEPPGEPDSSAPESGPVRLLLTYDAALGSTEEGRDRVAAALSALVLRETGIETEITWTTAKEVPALLAADQKAFDLYAGGSNAAGLDARGLLLSVPAAWLETYAPDFVSLMGSFIRPLRETVLKNGKPLEVEHTFTLFPLYKPVSEALYMDFRADLCEAAGYSRGDVETMTDWNQVYFLLKAARDAAGEGFVGMAPTEKYSVLGSGFIGPNVICNSLQFAETLVFDNLGDTLNLIYAAEDYTVFCPWLAGVGGDLPNPDESYKWYPARYLVQSRLNAWYDEGLIWPDADWDAYDGPEEDIFARAYRASELARSAPDRYRVKICNTMLTAAESVNGYFAIPAGAQNPAMALQVMNVLYARDTAGEWANLLVYGVRDVDYTVGEDGRYTPAEAASYWNAPLGCNSLFLTETDTEEPGLRLLQTVALEAMQRSHYYGCTVDTADYAQMRRSLRVVASRYIPQMSWGTMVVVWNGNPYSFDSRERDFQNALLEAGLADYMKLYQDRVSQWLAK